MKKSYCVLLDDDSHELWEIIRDWGEILKLEKEKYGRKKIVWRHEVWIIL